MLAEDGVESLVDKRTLTRTAHACHADHFAERDTYRYVLEIIAGTAFEGKNLTRFPCRGRSILHYRLFAFQVSGGEGICLEQIIRSAREEHFAAEASGFRTDIYYPVRFAHHLLIVLNDDDGVIHIP